MVDLEEGSPEWVTCGKSVKQLIVELNSFENQDMEVRISVDSGQSSCPISLVGKLNGKCVLIFFGN
jgi:hypothetical protein